MNDKKGKNYMVVDYSYFYQCNHQNNKGHNNCYRQQGKSNK